MLYLGKAVPGSIAWCNPVLGGLQVDPRLCQGGYSPRALLLLQSPGWLLRSAGLASNQGNWRDVNSEFHRWECAKWMNVPAGIAWEELRARGGQAPSHGYPPATWWEKGGVGSMETLRGSEKWC